MFFVFWNNFLLIIYVYCLDSIYFFVLDVCVIVFDGVYNWIGKMNII